MAPAARIVSGVPEEKKTKRCKWRGCGTKIEFKTIEDVVEHVLAEHIPKVVKDEDGEEEVVCEWDLCEMGTIRGDLEKKTSWMQNHFKTRHAKKAKTFKCLIEGCQEVRATSQEIETHVRLSHFSKKKSESISTSKESSQTPQEIKDAESKETTESNKVWRIEDGKVYWDPPKKVTKKTIVYYEDGPRYVYPTGCGRCNYESDESELASDEYWSPVFYSDEEETNRKSWRPPKNYHPVYNPGPSWYDPKNPPVTDSEEEARRRRPRRVKKKKPAAELAKKDRLHGVIDKITLNVGKTKDEVEREKKTGWIGSFWHQYLETQKTEQAKKEERELSEPPKLCEEPQILPKRSKIPKKMPSLTAHYEESADSESDLVSKRKVPKKVRFEEIDTKPQKKPISVEKSRKIRLDRACRPKYSFCEIDEDFEVKIEIETPKTKILLDPKRLKRAKIQEDPEPEKRPRRACRVLGSMEEVPFFIEIGVEDLLERPEKVKKAKK